MRNIRRSEKAITDQETLLRILDRVQYVTLAMSLESEPYLVTVNHFYDRDRNCIYFHCAQEGKKVDILRKTPLCGGRDCLTSVMLRASVLICMRQFSSRDVQGL